MLIFLYVNCMSTLLYKIMLDLFCVRVHHYFYLRVSLLPFYYVNVSCTLCSGNLCSLVMCFFCPECLYVNLWDCLSLAIQVKSKMQCHFRVLVFHGFAYPQENPKTESSLSLLRNIWACGLAEIWFFHRHLRLFAHFWLYWYVYWKKKEWWDLTTVGREETGTLSRVNALPTPPS